METLDKTHKEAQRYTRIWEEHINELARLAWHLQGEDIGRLKEIREELHGLRKKATMDLLAEERGGAR